MPFVTEGKILLRWGRLVKISGNRFNIYLHGNNDVLYKLTVILMPGYDNLELELVI